jgi:predicted amidophosphoribosyltransferase
VVRPAFVHDGVARILVHHLKYRGVVAAGRFLAQAMAPLVPPETVIVPVPRLRWRLLRYGVDPALELAAGVSRLTGQPLARLLQAPLLGRARAGRAHGTAPAFRPRPVLPVEIVLIDDVVTSGATLAAAASVLDGVVAAVTATGAATASGVTSLPPARKSVWR